MSSILNDIKEQLGLVPDDPSFDTEIVIHINTVFMTLAQLGVGPPSGFMITGSTEQWDQFVDETNLNAVKSYMFLRVKLLHDPPGTGFTTQSFDRQITELEWRLNAEVDF